MSSTHTFEVPPQPFTIAVADAEIADLNARLDSARWPLVDVVQEEEGAEQLGAFGMGYGPKLSLMKELASEWRNGYSWREEEKHLNTFNHFKVDIEDLSIHFLHHRSTNPDAVPLILLHGWPGSFLEFLPVIPLLTSKFHLVIPSQPGFAFSSPPATSHWKMDDTARVFDKLMTGLGYATYAAQGGDWGSITSRCLGALHGDHCKVVHLNFCPAQGPGLLKLINPRTLVSWLPRCLLSDLERERALRALEYVEKGSAYYAMQHNTPRTPAYGLNDSPVGLLAWIAEKMIPSVTRVAKSPNPSLTRKTVFNTCALYYFTSSIGTSFLPYALNPHFSTFLEDPKYFLPSFALSVFPHEIAVTPEKWVRKTGNLGWIKEAEDGGHFASLEEPRVFAEHVTEAIGALWKQ